MVGYLDMPLMKEVSRLVVRVYYLQANKPFKVEGQCAVEFVSIDGLKVRHEAVVCFITPFGQLF